MTPSGNFEEGRIVLVTGTDTGVGKTLVCAGLARNFSDRGFRVIAIKPVETGCGAAVSESEDGRVLSVAARQSDPDRALARLRAPLAPPVAADRESALLDLGTWVNAIQDYAKNSKPVLVEGAGGLLSPLTWKETARDLACELGAAALVVASDRLGTLNHTLLTLEALSRSAIPTIGVVFNAPEFPDSSTGGNRGALQRFAPEVRTADLPRVGNWEVAAPLLEEVSRWIVP